MDVAGSPAAGSDRWAQSGAAGPVRGADPKAVARAAALERLARAPQTRAQLETVLRRRGVPDEPAQAVLDRLGEVGLIDDAAYARAWVQSRHTGRGLARRALAHELRQRGVTGELVDAAIAELPREEEVETARRLVRSRRAGMRRLVPQARTRRVMAMLVRKGYPPALAARVTREELAGELEELTAELEEGAGVPPELVGEPEELVRELGERARARSRGKSGRRAPDRARPTR